MATAPGAPQGVRPGQARAGWAALVVVYLVWGSTYLAIRVADESLPPLVMASVRYLVAGGLLLPFVIRAPARPAPGPQAYRRAVTVPSGRQLAACAVIGAAMLAGGNGGVSWAERRVPSGLAALLVASVPLWMLLTDRVVTRAAPSRSALLALAIGFAGVGVLARLGSHPGETAGVVVVLCASVSWAVGSLLGRWLPQPARPLVATAFQMLAGGAVLALAAAISGEAAHFDPGTVSVRSWLALAYLIGPGSVLALTCFTVALRQLPTATVATYAYVNPVVAVTLGWAVLGEKVSTLTLVGGALIVAAVALVVRSRNHAH